MTTNEAMDFAVKSAIESGATAEQVSKIQIAIQYLGNPDFREKLNRYVFDRTYHASKN